MFFFLRFLDSQKIRKKIVTFFFLQIFPLLSVANSTHQKKSIIGWEKVCCWYACTIVFPSGKMKDMENCCCIGRKNSKEQFKYQVKFCKYTQILTSQSKDVWDENPRCFTFFSSLCWFCLFHRTQ